MKLKRQKLKSVKIPESTYTLVQRFKKRNGGETIIGRFVNNAILEKLDREERNFQTN